MSTSTQRTWIEQNVSDRVCPSCHRMFDTPYSRQTHLRKAAGCKDWISNSKRQSVEEPTEGEIEITLDSLRVADDFELENDIFHWINPDVGVEIGEAGPGPSTIETNIGLRRMVGGLPHSLRVKEAEAFSEPHQNGGKVIRMGEKLYEKWRARFRDEKEFTDDEEALYSPFTSKLEWQIAQWAVQENVGQGAFDRLLKIPGVSTLFRVHVQDYTDKILTQYRYMSVFNSRSDLRRNSTK